MRNLIRRALLSWAVVCAAVACGGDSTSPANIVVTGTWQLKTYNGSPPPVLLSQTSTTKVEVLADRLTLNADGTYSEIIDARVTQGVTVTTTVIGAIGVYQNANGAVAFSQTSPSSATFSGTVNGNTLTILEGGTKVFGR